MRIPVSLAWLLILLTAFTAGLLRQFHDETPRSPYVPPVIGSLLFAACFFLLLVAAREWRRGAVPGPGVRLGSVTPLLLMLLVEKWVSLSLYNPFFYWISPRASSNQLLDARFRAFAGVGLLLVCLLVARFSAPTARKTWRRAQPGRWPAAAKWCLAGIGATYALMALVLVALGVPLRMRWPAPSEVLAWILVGQAGLAFAEEVYYRGVLMNESERLAPRLGVRGSVGRRWTALLLTSGVFGMEHLRLGGSAAVLARQLVFAISLGLVLGLLVMLSANLHLAAGLHAWINWLLLGAAPRFVDATGRAVVPAGAYVGLALLLVFVAIVLRRRRWTSA